ncbi:MAG: N-acetylmuramoyl-L-alanine amidase-like domain-containing protein [Melioribacteraceae bacterium]
MRVVSAVVLLFYFISKSFAQPVYTQRDADICSTKFDLAIRNNFFSLPIGQLIIEIGKSFIGTDYAAASLEKNNEEKLIISLTGLDCYTFLESSLVFARCIREGRTNFEEYGKELENIRYRGGKMDGYESRLHYFSDWIFDMNRRGIGADVTEMIGGKPYCKKIDFMSTHTSSYRQLKNNPELVGRIVKIEKEIASRKNHYIPQDEIEKIEDKIESGDIIGITTNVEGLDIAHTGIAIRMEDGRIHFMHAPNVGYKVQITEKPLADYIKGNKKQTGIMVLRPE